MDKILGRRGWGQHGRDHIDPGGADRSGGDLQKSDHRTGHLYHEQGSQSGKLRLIAESGSITAYLALTLLVLLSLFFTALYSVRLAAERAVLSAGCESVLYSLFSRYDAELYRDYGLLFLNGGNSAGELDMGAVTGQIQRDADRILPAEKAPVSLVPEGMEISSYSLASDGDFQALDRQIREVMEAGEGPAAVSRLEAFLRESREVIRADQEKCSSYREDRAGDYYKGRRVILPDSEPAEETGENGPAEAEEEKPGPILQNPAETVKRWKKEGIMQLALDGGHLSERRVSLDQAASCRRLARGMGVVPESGRSRSEGAARIRYLMENFSCRGESSPGDGGLEYEIEYAIVGAESDGENLRQTVRKILEIRKTANLGYLLGDEEKNRVIDSLGADLAESLGQPETAPVLAYQIRLAWAYYESVRDIRILLSGGGIPLSKRGEDWGTGLSETGELTGGDEGHSQGLTYRDYLTILAADSESGLVDRMADVIEWNMDRRSDYGAFRWDACLDFLEIEMRAGGRSGVYTIKGSYGYAMG